MLYLSLFNNAFEALILFSKIYAAEIQLPGNGVLCTQSSGMACHW